MSHTERNAPLKHLTDKEKKLVEKHKFVHPEYLKNQEVHTQHAKKVAKKYKHKKDRILAEKDIKSSLSE